jgi:hypothetical protein
MRNIYKIKLTIYGINGLPVLEHKYKHTLAQTADKHALTQLINMHALTQRAHTANKHACAHTMRSHMFDNCIEYSALHV